MTVTPACWPRSASARVLPAEWAVAGDARFGDLQFVAEMLDARHRRADFLAGARRQRGAEHMARRVGAAGTGEDDRLAVKRIFHQGEDFSLVTELARGEDGRGVAVVRAVDDQRAGLIQDCFSAIRLRRDCRI